MKKWTVSALLISLTVAVVFWAFSSLFITYAEVLPRGVFFEIDNRESIERAIIKSNHLVIEHLRELHGESILVLSILAILNAIVASVVIIKGRG